MKRIPEPYGPEGTRDPIASLAKLKAEMAAAHPDRGGSNAAFIEARRRYVEARRATRRGRAETPLPHPHRRRHRHRKSMSWFEILLGLILLSPLLALVFFKIETLTQNDTNTKTAGNASAPAQKFTQSDTQSARKDTESSLQSTKNDLETRMGRVYERDNHYFFQDNFLQDVNEAVNRTARNLPPPKQVPVDEKLTAEEVFASRKKDEVQVLDRMFSLGSESCKGCLSEEALSESERLRYLGLVRIHRMAALTLYNDRCSGLLLDRNKVTAVVIIENQFKKLPREVQKKALDHQIKAIEVQPAVYYNNKYLIAPGGFEWFCNQMTDDINSGDAGPMFKTAREGFFPIEEN